MPVELKDFNTVAKPDWCPGCGNFGVLLAVKQGLAGQGIDPDMVAYISDIGCSGKTPHWVNTYGFHSLHGRAVPVACGVKLANPRLTVLASLGDGGAYGIGVGHLLQAIRRNADITCLVHHNQVYGLTKGQMTPTSSKGYKSPSSPHGKSADPLNPLALALAAGGTFVARGFVGKMPQLVDLIQAGFKHKGFALIDILQPCVTFNKVQTYEYYQKNTYNLNENGHDNSNLAAGLAKAMETEPLPLGILYKTERPSYEQPRPGHDDVAVVDLPLDITNINSLMKKFY